MTHTTDWILVADSSKARILQVPPHSHDVFPVQAAFIHSKGRLHRSQVESDAPGSFSLQGAARTAADPHEDVDHHEARKFALELCEHLNQACDKASFDRLVVVAPPRFLGVLREQMSPQVQKTLLGEFNQELAQLSDSQLHPHLVQMLSTLGHHFATSPY